MKQNHTKLAAVAGLGLALFAGAAFAAPIEITVGDKANAAINKNIFNGGPASGWVDVTGVNEDNETEKAGGFTAIASQAWDMEAVTFDPVTKKLKIVTGYNMSTGLDGWDPGDLFIKVGGLAPDAGTNVNGTGTVTNGIFGTAFDPNGYSFAVDLSLAGGISTSSTTVTNVYSLDNNSVLETAHWDAFISNPWRYKSGATNTGSTTVTYRTGLTAGDVATNTGVAGLSSLKGNAGAFNTTPGSGYNAHNVLTVDLGFLGTVPAGTNVYFHYVMECGNDMIDAKYGGGFDVPDHGTSVLLIGLGLAAMSLAGIKRRRS